MIIRMTNLIGIRILSIATLKGFYLVHDESIETIKLTDNGSQKKYDDSTKIYI